ncbi:MAG TPA: transposase [Bryobacteraceae bacterium]|nr:transposase [Bryobacteraceae bacterium]
MDGSTPSNSKPPQAPKRRNWSPEDRQRIVEASWKAGTSVNAVARAYGVRASQIYQWRKRHRKQARSRKPATLLPVEVAERIRPPRGAKQHDFRIMIEARGARVTLDGSVEAELVRTLLECLAQ